MGIRPWYWYRPPPKKVSGFRVLTRKVSGENPEFLQKPGVDTKIQFDNNGP